MARNKEKMATDTFSISNAEDVYSFQLKKNPSLWWLWLLLLLLIGLLVWYLMGNRIMPVGPFPSPNDSTNVGRPVGPPPVPKTGDVQILLSWSNYNDLDLSCEDPYGDIVSFVTDSVPSGGKLDIDMNANDSYRSDTPIENIFWPRGGAPKGKYTVYLTYYAKHTLLKRKTPYTVTVKHGGKTDTYSGTMKWPGQIIEICTFTMD
jgi:hypothetical protein